MAESTHFLATEAETAALAGKLAARARPGDVLLLSGPLGAGKSAFARAFIQARSGNPTLEVPSPTFTLVQSYELPDIIIWHYDLWRLTGPDALHELAWDEAQAGIMLVEWPERLGNMCPAQALAVTISPNPAGREIRLIGEQRWFLDAS
ncbi:MAG: tRNA (adenosine(37)-N6)-threonylcarbamoyltransferase complex ATPase subunit type 1 TsaE [Acidocella sp. 20-57-95]|nr:MAG: tRNA (adenosine(37)-N6)-threonylcarbamoyltransferase complex ATPase subunit type 1 TsaE [Acidocella sp. 20-57-95]OYV58343.1 MAG: tRNA (adenosine(37)-N6)-threonylcarbamoyltransferase complex ATPase subunit type 1 TsaE [Acidocella sp. 21-58-7]HQT64398.1 tRNA (adenosine(37)-N6)-threonylcarbamoyltransferase complex ATPase subunit type 1 TsaE [Acidocella sp.]HQU04875.1 tRNA (adenosine(37)-N6)-threonylcarbamoyltransferase complex ATPase subunit type 1 TsaE [Acidocella sp.]